MALNIKNAAVERLAADLAERAGLSKTQAVKLALEETLARRRRAEERQALRAWMLEIGQQTRADLAGTVVPDHGDLLYDEAGLPR